MITLKEVMKNVSLIFQSLWEGGGELVRQS